MNEQIEAIRNEIERRMEKHWDLLPDADSPEDDWTHNELCELGAYKELEHLETFVDSLPEEPAPKGYDEAYLNECIAKASKTWEGVDVDKYVDEVRGNRPKLSDSLEEAARHSEILAYPMPEDGDIEKVMKVQEARIFHEIGFIAGANWQKEQMMDEWLKDRGGCFWDGVEEGKKAMEEQMMKEAVEGTVMDFSSNRPRPQVDVLLDPHKYHTGDKVRIIIVKEDNQ